MPVFVSSKADFRFRVAKGNSDSGRLVFPRGEQVEVSDNLADRCREYCVTGKLQEVKPGEPVPVVDDDEDSKPRRKGRS